MKYLMIFLEGAGASLLAAKKPNIDALAANGRVGVLNTKSTDTVNTTLRLLGCHGSGSGEGKICLRCSPVLLDSRGNVKEIPREDTTEELAEALGSMEIDGVKFEAEAADSKILIVMSGEGISAGIIPNKCSPGMPLPQIGAASKSAKRTASVLNKLLYRLAKGKKNVTFSVTGGALQLGHSFSERFGLSGCCVSDDALVKAVARCLGMGVMNFEGVKSIESALGSHDFVFFSTSEKIENFDKEIFGQLKTMAFSDSIVTVMIFKKTSGEPMPALVCGGGILPGETKSFSEAACSRGFRVGVSDFLPWVLRATGGGFSVPQTYSETRKCC